MAEPTTNLTDIAADRISIWNNEARTQEDIRSLFVNNAQIKPVTRIEQQVGDEVDIILVFEDTTNQQVPALKDLVEYIAQEKLGADATINKHYTINRKNLALIQDVETIPRRGRHGPVGGRGARGAAGKAQIVIHEAEMLQRRGRSGATGERGAEGPEGSEGPEGPRGLEGETGPAGARGPEGPDGLEGPAGPRGPDGSEGGTGVPGVRGVRGAAGKAQIVVQEGNVYTTTKSAPSIRGRQEMVLCQGDTHLSRITKNREVKQCTVNHTETTLLNVTKRSSSTRNELLLFQEGDRTTIRNHAINRKTVQNIEVFAPITAYRKPKQVVKRSAIIDVFSPVLLQRITNVTKVNRSIYIFSPC
jgi:hypothetical protein